MSFHENLRTLRLARGLTQPALAEKANIEQSYLSKLENGRSKPSEDVLARLAQALEVKAEALLQNGDDAEERGRRWRLGLAATGMVLSLVLAFFLGRATAVYPLSFNEVVKGASADENLVLDIRSMAPQGMEVINVSSGGSGGRRISVTGKTPDYATLTTYMRSIQGKFGGGFSDIQLEPVDPINPAKTHHFNMTYEAAVRY